MAAPQPTMSPEGEPTPALPLPPTPGAVTAPPRPAQAGGQARSMHEDVPYWQDCCSCEAEPYWVEAMAGPDGDRAQPSQDADPQDRRGRRA
jgi:hypothetical protein